MRYVFVVCGLPLLAACQMQSLAGQPAAAPQPLNYMCGQTPVVATYMGYGVMQIALGGQQLELTAVPAASGAKYEVEAGGQSVSFWQKDTTALLTVNGAEQPTCHLEGTVEATVLTDYRAIGQEPGWHLFFDGEAITFLADYGQTRFIAPQPQPNMLSGGLVYQTSAQGQPLRVEVLNTPCQDVMSGFLYPDTVTITIAGAAYKGCGGTPVEGKVE
jgi:uncharacterized membrane protein